VTVDASVFVAVHELYGRWSHALDTGHPDLVVDDFTPDGVLWVSDRGSYRGRDEIAEITRGRAGAVLHVITNVIVEDATGDRARAHAYFHMVDMAAGQVVARGMYDDDLVGAGGRWRWHRKAVDFLWRSDGYATKADQLRRPDYGRSPNPVGHFAAL